MNNVKQTVAVQKAIDATKALVGIANGVEWRAYQQLKTDTRGIVTERMAQTILDALQQPPAAPPPADSEDRQLATIARGIAETLEVYELPLSGAPVFAYRLGSSKYGADINIPHDYPFMESLRQLALWKAGQQVAEAAEAAPVDALAKGNGDGGYSDYAAALRKIEDCILALTTCADDQRWQELQVSSEHREAIADRYENAAHDNLKTLVSLYRAARERIAELEAERDSAVREANKRAFLLREIEFYSDPKNRVDGEVLAHKLDSIHERIVYVTASPSAPESEAINE